MNPQNRLEIIRCLNPKELFQHLCDEGLLDPEEEEGGFIFDDSIPTRDKNERLLALLETKGPSAYLQFLNCLDEETNHMGHAYLACLLRGQSFGGEQEIQISCRIQKQTKRSVRHLVQGVNFDSLVTYLRAHALVTDNEIATLRDTSQRQDYRVSYFLRLLSTKGPTAYYTFAHCLEEEDEHCTHEELFQMITCEKDRPLLQRKRKADGDIPVTKRVPDRLRAQESLVSKEYFDSLRRIRKHHLAGEWEKADAVVRGCMRGGDDVICIAVMLENCTGYITRYCVDRGTVYQNRQSLFPNGKV